MSTAFKKLSKKQKNKESLFDNDPVEIRSNASESQDENGDMKKIKKEGVLGKEGKEELKAFKD